MLIPPIPLHLAVELGSNPPPRPSPARGEGELSPVRVQPSLARRQLVSAKGKSGISPAVGISGRTFDRRRTSILGSPSWRPVGLDRQAERLGRGGRVRRAAPIAATWVIVMMGTLVNMAVLSPSQPTVDAGISNLPRALVPLGSRRHLTQRVSQE